MNIRQAALTVAAVLAGFASAQTIQDLPLEIREVSVAEVKKAFRKHGLDAGFLKTADE